MENAIYALKLNSKVWNINEIPREDWKFSRYLVFGRYRKCDICGQRMNRVHFLTHPSVGEVRVGNTCAAKLLKTYDPDKVEADYQRRLRNITDTIVDPEEKFYALPWETSKHGNLYKLFGSYVFKIAKDNYNDGFAISVTRRTVYKTADEAQQDLSILLHLITKEQSEDEETNNANVK